MTHEQEVAGLKDKLAQICALTWDFDNGGKDGVWDNVRTLSVARVRLLMELTADEELYELAQFYVKSHPSGDQRRNMVPDLRAIAEGLEL